MIPPGSIPVAAATDAISRWQLQVQQHSNGFLGSGGLRVIEFAGVIFLAAVLFNFRRKLAEKKVSAG